MAGGRPTLYTEELLEKAKSYVGGQWEDLGHAIPSIQGLCITLGIGESIAYVWVGDEDKKEFLDIINEIKTKQHFALVNKGLKSEVNAQIAKLILGKHGYSEKVEQEVKGEGGGPVIIERRIVKE